MEGCLKSGVRGHLKWEMVGFDAHQRSGKQHGANIQNPH